MKLYHPSDDLFQGEILGVEFRDGCAETEDYSAIAYLKARGFRELPEPPADSDPDAVDGEAVPKLPDEPKLPEDPTYDD